MKTAGCATWGLIWLRRQTVHFLMATQLDTEKAARAPLSRTFPGVAHFAVCNHLRNGVTKQGPLSCEEPHPGCPSRGMGASSRLYSQAFAPPSPAVGLAVSGSG